MQGECDRDRRKVFLVFRVNSGQYGNMPNLRPWPGLLPYRAVMHQQLRNTCLRILS